MKVNDFQKKYNYKKSNSVPKMCANCKYCTIDVQLRDDGTAELYCKNPIILDSKMTISFFDTCDLWESK